MHDEYNPFHHINRILDMNVSSFGDAADYIKNAFVPKEMVDQNPLTKVDQSYLSEDGAVGCVITEKGQAILAMAITNFSWHERRQMLVSFHENGEVGSLCFGNLEDQRLLALRPDLHIQGPQS